MCFGPGSLHIACRGVDTLGRCQEFLGRDSCRQEQCCMSQCSLCCSIHKRSNALPSTHWPALPRLCPDLLHLTLAAPCVSGKIKAGQGAAVSETLVEQRNNMFISFGEQLSIPTASAQPIWLKLLVKISRTRLPSGSWRSSSTAHLAYKQKAWH